MPGPHAIAAPELWLFDLDGVLVDTTRCHARAFAELWRELGVNGPPYERIAGRRTRDAIAEVTASLTPDARQLDDWTRFKQEHARVCLLQEDVSFPDSARSLQSLRSTGCLLALGTAASRETTTAVLERHGWASAFHAIVTGDDVRLGKPEPDIYLEAMRQSGAAPERTLIIEDSNAGLQAASASGAYHASVRSGLSSRSDRFIGTFPDLAALLTSFGVTA